VGGASEAEEDGGGVGDGEKEGHSTSKSGDTKPETQPPMDRGLALIVMEVPLDGGDRRSFRGQGGGGGWRRRWMETVKWRT
jgi:hypothetical protein